MLSEQAKLNRSVRARWGIEASLKVMTGDQRRRLLDLYEHPNLQVQLNAAAATLAVSPEVARAKLRDIANWGIPPTAADAGLILRSIRIGRFVPS